MVSVLGHLALLLLGLWQGSMSWLRSVLEIATPLMGAREQTDKGKGYTFPLSLWALPSP
ncbi:rCG59614, partial [Rattus norvegicus]